MIPFDPKESRWSRSLTYLPTRLHNKKGLYCLSERYQFENAGDIERIYITGAIILVCTLFLSISYAEKDSLSVLLLLLSVISSLLSVYVEHAATVATESRYGELQSNLTESCVRYLRVGAQIVFEGRLRLELKNLIMLLVAVSLALRELVAVQCFYLVILNLLLWVAIRSVMHYSVITQRHSFHFPTPSIYLILFVIFIDCLQVAGSVYVVWFPSKLNQTGFTST